MSRTILRILILPFGFVAGGAIGAYGAPAWEMAILFVGFFGAVCGAITAAALASSWRGLLVALLAIGGCAGMMALLSAGNPTWVMARSTLAVVAAGAAGLVLGFLAGKLPASQTAGNLKL